MSKKKRTKPLVRPKPTAVDRISAGIGERIEALQADVAALDGVADRYPCLHQSASAASAYRREALAIVVSAVALAFDAGRLGGAS